MRKDLIVEDQYAGLAIRNYVSIKLPEVTQKGVRRALKRGQITLNGARVASNHPVQPGDDVMVHIQDAFSGDARGIRILHEDDFIAVIYKPEGISVSGERVALNHRIKSILQPSGQHDATLNPVVLHRLDKATRGVMLVAKTRSAVKYMTRQFEDHTIRKEYRATVHGKVENAFTADFPVDGKEAETIFHLKSYDEQLHRSIVIALPKHGRRHQIRLHLSRSDFPIVGDRRYGQSDDAKRLHLVAVALTFRHPQTQETMHIQLDSDEMAL